MLRVLSDHASDAGTRDDAAYFGGSGLGMHFAGWVPAIHAEPQEALRVDAFQRVWE